MNTKPTPALVESLSEHDWYTLRRLAHDKTMGLVKHYGAALRRLAALDLATLDEGRKEATISDLGLAALIFVMETPLPPAKPRKMTSKGQYKLSF